MPTVLRRYRFKLHPTAAQEEALRHQARLLAALWNGMLELCNNTYWCRREAAGLPWKAHGRAFGAFRHSEPEWHKPSRPWSAERKAREKALREAKAEAKRKGKPKPPPKPKKEGGIQGLSAQNLTAEVTAVRSACPEFDALSVKAMERVAQSLDRAFKAAFERIKKGEKPGFPKFKPTRDASQIPLGSDPKSGRGSAWSLSPVGRVRPRADGTRASARRWKMYLQAVPGLINARGEFPATPKSWKTADIDFSAGSWWLSVCIEIERDRQAGDDAATVHLNLIDEFARVERAMGPRRAREAQVSQSEEGSRPPSQNPYPLNSLAIGSPNSQASADERANVPMPPYELATPNSQPSTDERTLEYVEGSAGACRIVEAESEREPQACADDGPPKWSVHCSLLGEKIDELKAERDRRYPRKPGRKASWRSRALSARISRLTARQARIRREAQHRWSTALISTVRDLTVFAPAIQKHTKSPRGDEKNWGAAVKDVTALNRHILNYAPAAAVEMLHYKAEEAGIRCDIIVDEAPAIAIGAEQTRVAKKQRRASRLVKREAA